jgi:hypothetical protein
MPRQALDLDQARDVGGLVLRQGMPDHQVSTAAIVASRRRAGSEEARADQEPRASRRASRAVRCRVFCHSSRTTICRTHSFEIPTASPIALSVAPAFRALAIALSRPTPRAISCCNLGITVLSRRVRSFVRAAALARASFSWRMYEGYVSVAPLRRWRPETPRYPPHLPHAPPFSERSHSRHPCGSRNHQTPNLKPSRQRRLNPTIPPHGGPATSGECSPDPALGCTPSTDIGRHSEEGSFVPRAAVSRCSKVRVQLGLLDHLIRGHKKARCHREADAMSRHRTRCLL